jgi:hypothetical protein
MEKRRHNDLHQLEVYRCALHLYRRIKEMTVNFPAEKLTSQAN